MIEIYLKVSAKYRPIVHTSTRYNIAQQFQISPTATLQPYTFHSSVLGLDLYIKCTGDILHI